MGQTSDKLMTSAETRIDKAFADLELLNKTGTQRAYEVVDVFRHLESSILTLKGEREYLKRQIKKLEAQTYSSLSSRDRSVLYNEVGTQTETDGDVNLSMLNETLRSRIKELEEVNTKFNENIKPGGAHSGKILTSLACQAILPHTVGDEYLPVVTGVQNIQDIQSECEKILNDNDVLHQEIRKLGKQLNQERKEHEETKNRIRYLDIRCKENEELQKRSAEDRETIKMFKNDTIEKIHKIQELENCAQELKRQLEQSRRLNDKNAKDQKTEESNLLINQLKGKLDVNEKQLQEMKRFNTKLDDCNNELRNKNSSAEKKLSVLEKRIPEMDAMVINLERKLSHLDEQYKISCMTIEVKKADLKNLREQIQHKESELILYKQQMDTEFKKLTNDLSLEAVNFAQEKTKTEELDNNILRLKENISDLQLTNNKLEADLVIRENVLTQEKAKMQDRITELSNSYASLLEKYEPFKKEKEIHGQTPWTKKNLSFHSVLRQPQSDQAVLGIVSLLQAEMPNSQVEIIQEVDRTRDNPLLVVLYNLSNLITDAKSALSGIEAATNVALVVLHAKAIKKPSKHILTEQEFKKLGIIVDMSFLSAKGIISNELTDDAIQRLVEFINRF